MLTTNKKYFKWSGKILLKKKNKSKDTQPVTKTSKHHVKNQNPAE